MKKQYSKLYDIYNLAMSQLRIDDQNAEVKFKELYNKKQKLSLQLQEINLLIEDAEQ